MATLPPPVPSTLPPRRPHLLQDSLDIGEPQDEDFYLADTCPEDEDEDDMEEVEERVPRYPSQEDESPLTLKLSGRNEVPDVVVDGWTSSIPLNFPGIRPDLKLKLGEIPEGASPLSLLENERSNGLCLSLLTISGAQTERFTPLRETVVAQVVAKKSPTVILYPSKGTGTASPHHVGVIGNAIIADPTGTALLTCWNEATSLFLDKVRVGDYVVIKKATSKKIDARVAKYAQPFRHKMVDLEIKIDKYDVRGIEVYQSDLIRNVIEFPCMLFGNEPKIIVLVPSDITRSIGILPKGKEDVGCVPKSEETPQPQRELIVMGVISYVGRVERVLENCQRVASSDGVGTKEVAQFGGAQCLELVDLKSAPLLVKLRLNKNTVNAVGKVVVGSLVVITHCQLSSGILTHHIQTTEYSHVYVNEACANYLSLLPRIERRRLSAFLKVSNIKEIYGREDVTWKVGGTSVFGIINPELLLNDFWSRRPEEEKTIAPGKVFARRERFDCVVKVKIIGAYIVKSESCKIHIPHPLIIHEHLFRSYFDSKGFQQLVDSSKCCCTKCHRSHWHSRQRKLPPVDIPTTPEISLVALLKAAAEQHAEACGPFGLPAKYRPMPKRALPPVSKLPEVNEEPAFLVVMVDEVNKVKYSATWRGFAFYEMKRKLLEAKNRKSDVIAVLHVFCVESGEEHGLEVILHDFLPLKDADLAARNAVPSA